MRFWTSWTFALACAATLGFASMASGGAVTSYDLYYPGHIDHFQNTDNGGNEYPAIPAIGVSEDGKGSWKSDPDVGGDNGKHHLIYVQGDQPGPGAGGQISYPTHGENPQLLFDDLGDEQVRVRDITHMSWTTKKPGSAMDVDWYVNLFTHDPDEEWWYGTNLNFSGRANIDPDNYNDGGWNTWEVSSAKPSPLEVEVGEYDGGSIDYDSFGNWLDNDDASWLDEDIRFLALGTGTSWDDPASYLDTFSFSYQTDDMDDLHTVEVNFQAVPTPAAGLAGVALAGLLGFVRPARRRERV